MKELILSVCNNKKTKTKTRGGEAQYNGVVLFNSVQSLQFGHFTGF